MTFKLQKKPLSTGKTCNFFTLLFLGGISVLLDPDPHFQCGSGSSRPKSMRIRIRNTGSYIRKPHLFIFLKIWHLSYGYYQCSGSKPVTDPYQTLQIRNACFDLCYKMSQFVAVSTVFTSVAELKIKDTLKIKLPSLT
jgi:hypothetical protein